VRQSARPAPLRHSLSAKPSPEWFTGIAMPALVDLTTGQVHHHEGRVMVGAVYVPFLRAQSALVTDVVARA